MRAVILLFLFLFGLISSFVFMVSEAYASSDKRINDSFVENLSCQNLSVDNIYRAVRDNAYHEAYHMPVTNWKIEDGVPGLANCWALAKTQRMMFYLARYRSRNVKPLEDRVALVMDMIRGATIVKKGKEKPLKSYQVFDVEESTFGFASKDIGWNLWKGIFNGYGKKLGSDYIFRNLKTEIEALQNDRFFELRNIGMILKSGERSAENNSQTIKKLVHNLDGKRLTLLNLRMKRNRQHIVMAKSYSKFFDGTYLIRVYDSNYPTEDSIVYYDEKTSTFTAPHIVGRVLPREPDRSLGVFIVDEEDRQPYEKAMLKHYQTLCR